MRWRSVRCASIRAIRILPTISSYSARLRFSWADQMRPSQAYRERAPPIRLWYVHMDLAAAYGMQQRIDEAKHELAESLRLRPEFASLAAIKAAMPQYDSLSRLAQAQETLLTGMRRAGLPDK